MWDLDYTNKLNIEAAAKNISVDEVNSFRDSHPGHDDRTDFEVACMIVEQDKFTPMHFDGSAYTLDDVYRNKVNNAA